MIFWGKLRERENWAQKLRERENWAQKLRERENFTLKLRERENQTHIPPPSKVIDLLLDAVLECLSLHVESSGALCDSGH